MNKPPDETLKQGRNRSWLLVKFGTGSSLRNQLSCFQDQNDGCHHVKACIQHSSTSTINQTYNTSLVTFQREDTIKRLPYYRYCDSFWDLLGHVDEDSSACRQWICPKHQHQYQCQTGQCIRVGWACDGEWDCSDASDEEAIVLVKQWSDHNKNLTNLPYRLAQCEDRYEITPFSENCNTPFEFGCCRSGVSNALDIDSYHPCINLSQIGDGVEDCYNAYDEKNTFTAQSTVGGMWGFHAQCGRVHRRYTDTCIISTNIYCSDVLCSRFRDKDGSCSDEKDFLCIKDNQCKKNKRCDGNFDCAHFFYKQPRPVSTLLKGLIRWLVHIHYNPKAITKTEYSTLIFNKRESVVAACLIFSHAS